MEKLIPMEGIFKKLEQNGFHQSENRFPLTRMKECLENRYKNDFQFPENLFPLTGMQESFKNAIPLDGKIKLSAAGVSENGRRK